MPNNKYKYQPNNDINNININSTENMLNKTFIFFFNEKCFSKFSIRNFLKNQI